MLQLIRAQAPTLADGGGAGGGGGTAALFAHAAPTQPFEQEHVGAPPAAGLTQSPCAPHKKVAHGEGLVAQSAPLQPPEQTHDCASSSPLAPYEFAQAPCAPQARVHGCLP